MTKLERFRRTAKGAALSGVLAAALFPAMHGTALGQVDKGPRDASGWKARIQTALASAAGPEFDERVGWTSPRVGETERMRIQDKALEAALARMEARTALLESGLAAYGRLYTSLQRMASEAGDGVPVTEQAQLLSEALRSGLSIMKAETSGHSAAMPEDGGQPSRTAQAAEMDSESLKGSLAHKADAINLMIEDNRLLEDVLAALSGKFDDALRAADKGEAGAYDAAEALQDIAAILRQYREPNQAATSSLRP